MQVEPIVPWIGGKRWWARKFSHLFIPPEVFNSLSTVVEPFMGGGIISQTLAARAQHEHLEVKFENSDINPSLVCAHRAVQEDPDRLSRLLESYPMDKQHYKSFCSQPPPMEDTVAHGAWFIHTVRLAYGAQIRVNKQGQVTSSHKGEPYNLERVKQFLFAQHSRSSRFTYRCEPFTGCFARPHESGTLWVVDPRTV